MQRTRTITEDDLKVLLGNMRKVSAAPTKMKLNITSGNPIVRPLYKSKLEAQYAAHLDVLVKAGDIKRWVYEPMSLKLSEGKRYRPDFLVVLPLGREAKPEMREVKGKWTKNRRDAMTHLKWATQLYGDVFTFRLIQWNGHDFEGSSVVV